MANRLSSTDFTFYLAVCPGDFRRYERYLSKHDLLFSVAYSLNGADRPSSPVAYFLEVAPKLKGKLMMDSGGFTNFTEPGTVRYEQWREFVKSHSSWVTEYVQLDDLRSRQRTLENYARARKDGFKPLFVDHLFFRNKPSQLAGIWKSEDKLCLSGFAKTLPGQRQFPGDPVQRFRAAMEQADADDTHTHLLAVGSMRRFLPYIRRIHSVDSAGWDKAAAYGLFLTFAYEDYHGVKIPILRGYSAPYSENKKPMPPGLQSKAWHGVLRANGWEGRGHSSCSHLVSLYHVRRYIEAVRKFDPKDLREALKSEKILKSFDLGEPTDFMYEEDDPRHPETPDCGWDPPPDLMPVQQRVAWAALPAAMLRSAEHARRADRITVGEFFYQPKPTRPTEREVPQSVENLIAFVSDREELLPAIVQKKYDGVRVQIHRKADTVRVLTEDGGDVTARLPGLVKAVLALKPDPLVLDAELERWEGGKHLPREATSGYLSSHGEPDDSDVVANVFDVLWFGEDLHKEPLRVRLRALDRLGIADSTMQAPDDDVRLNAVPSARTADLTMLERVVRRVSALPGSEGVVLKQEDSVYPLEQRTQDTWVKFHNAAVLRGLIIGGERTAGGAYVYQWGLRPSDVPFRLRVSTVAGEKVVPVGDTFATSRRLRPGDGVLVEVEQLNLTKDGDNVTVTGWVPRVVGVYDGRPDEFNDALRKAKRARILREKVVRDGEVRYLPQLKVEKQEDPYLEIPREGRRIGFVVHNHWRGKSLHADVRMEFRPDLLIGWTLNTQIQGVVKEPVMTLGQAKAWRRRMDEVSKIDWTTGEWAERERRGASKPVRTSILSERKAPEPHAWLSVEGATPAPKPGGAPPVGGTRQYPGVFSIEDAGTVEFGAQKPWLHEYFFHGKAFNYRVFWRLLRLGQVEKARHSHSRCMRCEQAAPKIDVIWADGRGRAWFCKRCYPLWKKEVGEWAEIVRERRIVGPAAPREFGEVHKAVTVGKSAVLYPLIRKALPPSEAPEAGALDGRSWLAIYPDDPVPYVLSNDAVAKSWMPPIGVSALPAAIREQLPERFRYWQQRSARAALSLRDQLHAALKSKDVIVDWEAPYATTKKAGLLDADFVLQEQTWRGPIQIRTGPSRTIWWLRFDVGRPQLLVLRLYRNPMDNRSVAAEVQWDRHKDVMRLTGDIAPGHWLNPSKDTPSRLRSLDTGPAQVLSLSPDFIKVLLKGSQFKGLFGLTRNDGEWLWAPAEQAPDVEDSIEKRAEAVVSVSRFVPILKVDKPKRLVTGVVLEPGEIDAHEDIVPADVVEKAAHKFLADYNSRTRLGLMHKAFGDVGLQLAESWLAPSNMRLGNEDVKKGTWLMTVKVVSDEQWSKVKRGEYTGFSIGGIAKVPG